MLKLSLGFERASSDARTADRELEIVEHLARANMNKFLHLVLAMDWNRLQTFHSFLLSLPSV